MTRLAKIIEYLLYLLVFLLPWQTRWIWHLGKLGEGLSQYLSLGLYGTQIILFCLFILAIIFAWTKYDPEVRILNFKLLNFYILYAMILIFCLVALYWSPDKIVALDNWLKLASGLGLIIFVVNFQFDSAKLGLVWVGGAVLQALLGIYQFFSQTVWANKWLGMAEQILSNGGTSVVESASGRWLRAYGSFPHPNILGGYLAISLIILIVLLFLLKDYRQRFFLWLSLPLLCVGLFFTFSKSAILALIIGLAFILLFAFISKDKYIKVILGHVLLVMIAVTAILVLFYQDPVLARIQGQTRLEQQSGQERILYFNEAKQYIIHNYWTGSGLGNYTLALYNQDLNKKEVWAYQPVHNVYLLILAELGLVGFVIYMMLLIEIFREIYHFKFSEYTGLIEILGFFSERSIYEFYRKRLYWFIGCSAIFIMLLVIMVFDHYLWTSYFGITLACLSLGLLLKQVGYLK